MRNDDRAREAVCRAFDSTEEADLVDALRAQARPAWAERYARRELAYGLHVTSNHLPSGIFASRPGPLMAASWELDVTVTGVGSHGSSPHYGNDPIPVLAEQVTALRTAAATTTTITKTGHDEA